MRRLLAVVALISLAVALCGVACSNQGEGGQCNTNDDNNGNDDCSNGLVCDPAASLGGVYGAYGSTIPGFGYCCPTDRTQATTATCSIAATVPGGNNGIPAEGGADGGVTTDAQSDSPTSLVDAPTDSPESTDALGDAPSDSPADSSGD